MKIPRPPVFGGLEAGGTKCVCAVSASPDDIRAEARFATTTPGETIPQIVRFFEEQGPITALGIGSFGPLEPRRWARDWGSITTTPKPGWQNVDIVSPLADSLRVPVAFDTDVNAAALGEQRWGSARYLDTFCYITVGTGIGGGGPVNGQLLHGLRHPEFGHMRIPHDRTRDTFTGCCRFHGDCLEGLASGKALHERWGAPAEELDDVRVWELEAFYLAHGITNVISVFSPKRIVLGGGVMKNETLMPLVRELVRELAGGYLDTRELSEDIADYIVAPALGDRAGVVGAIELARDVAV